VKLAIVRPSPGVLDARTYNIQEVGLATALLGLGIDVDVFLAGTSASPVSTPLETPGPGSGREIRLPVRHLPGRQGWFKDLGRMLDRGSYDLVQTHEDTQVTSAVVATWARKHDVPCVLCQGMYRDYRGGMKHALQLAYDAITLPMLRRGATGCLAKTRAAAGYLRSKGFEGVEVLPVGLDPERLGAADALDWRRRLGIPADAIVFLYVGVVEERRRPDLVVAGMLAALTADPRSVLVVVGKGPAVPALLAEAEALGDAFRRVEAVDQEELAALYKSADFFLLPSDYEIYGVAALESLYCGTPVIASATGGLCDLVSDGENGILVIRNDPASWEGALARAVALDAGVAQGMGRRAAADAARLTWDALAPRYAGFYRGLVPE
jgi:glycosyltransferase involved in cell wall biosynthesis